jgi:VanZ family protein
VDTVPPGRIVGEGSTQRPGKSDCRQRYRLFAAMVWTLLIMVLCWMPSNLVREVEDESSWFKIPHLDKIIHCALFAGFSVLWLRVRQFRRPIALVVTSGFALAVLTEIVQSVPLIGRDTSVADMVTDGIGVLVGIAIAPLVEPLARTVESRVLRATTGPSPAAEIASAAREAPR